MDTSREIKEDSSFNMTLLILVIGLVGIGGALLLNNIPLLRDDNSFAFVMYNLYPIIEYLGSYYCHFYDQLFHIGYLPDIFQ
mgnify:CR=1 FL=1